MQQNYKGRKAINILGFKWLSVKEKGSCGLKKKTQQTKITKWWHKPDTKRYNTEKPQMFKKMAEVNPKLC